MDQAKRLKEFEQENSKLKPLVANLSPLSPFSLSSRPRRTVGIFSCNMPATAGASGV